MSDREDRLRSLLDKVRHKRPDERTTRAAEALDRIRTASGTTAATQSRSAPPEHVQPSVPAQVHSSAPPTVPPTPFPSSVPTQLPDSPLPEPLTSPTLDSPTRYSSQPPRVERPLSVGPRTRSIGSSSSAPSGASSSAPSGASSSAPSGASSSAPSGASSSAPSGASSSAPSGASSSAPSGASSSAPSGATRPPAGGSQSRRPEAIRPQSVAPTGQPVLYATDPPEFPRPKTFGDLLELTLSLRPR
jgi:hypothetical protein